MSIQLSREEQARLAVLEGDPARAPLRSLPAGTPAGLIQAAFDALLGAAPRNTAAAPVVRSAPKANV